MWERLKLISARRRWAALLVLLLALIGAWRMWGPVYVSLAYTVTDLPFEVQTFPAGLWVRPGEVLNVTYRIRNTDILPLEALGRVDVEPGWANDQVQIFLTQCSGLNAFQASYPMDYQVVFRVEPAGWFGSSWVTIRHSFTRANLRH